MIPIILSGGSGTRLWPLSRTKTPKQFTRFFSKSLQELTLERVQRFGTPWVISNVALKDHSILQFKQLGLSLDHLILEPVGRNTAPAIALTCKILSLRGHGSETIGVFASDHLIQKVDNFERALKVAETEAKKGRVVTLGIQPTHPATGYGYIEVQKGELNQASAILRFLEKPNLERAREFIKSPNYFWNAGIFVFQIPTMIDLLRQHTPDLWSEIDKLNPDLSNLTEIFNRVKSISIDYAILEKLGSESLSCVPCDIGWNDVGSWDSIAEIAERPLDSQVEVNASGNYAQKLENKLYVFAGVDDLIAVDTKDALLITRRGQSEKVRDVVEKLRDVQPALLQQHPDEERPWGGFEILKNTESFKSKVVIVNPGQQISYQSHNMREEHWIIVEGSGIVVLDGKDIPVERGSYVKIPLQSKHRIRNTGENVMKFVEVQLGSYFGEDDIIRYQDDYQRS